MIKKIIIIGAGWYGLHIYNFLITNYNTQIDVVILEKENIFFNNSSNYNQNRLHLGYHYPRCNKTRNLCKKGYHKFIKQYRDILDFIDNNFYCISKDSFIDYDTYIKIYSNDIDYDHTIINNNFLNNIDGQIINTKEKIINSEKAKKYFLKDIDAIRLNYKVNKIENKNDKIIINDDIECDLVIDCTYNQQQLSKKKYIYENTISLLYNRVNFTDNFDSLTVMDGSFFSLFPRNITKELYTLTHVKYTPFISSTNINDILSNDNKNIDIETIKKNMELEVKKYYKNFYKHFEYIDYFTSYKCKNVSLNDSRNCNIEEYNNIITVNCGKIIGIYEFEEYMQEFMINFLN